MPAPAPSIQTVLSHGAQAFVWRGETLTVTEILGLQNVDFPDRMPVDLDMTHQGSPGLTEENRPGLMPAVDWTLDFLLAKGSAGDTALTALNSRSATTGDKELHVVGASIDGVQRAFFAYLKDYRPGAPLKGMVTMRATWRVMAATTWPTT